MSRNLVRATAIGCGLLAIAIRLYYDLDLVLREPFEAWFLGGFVAEILVPFGLLTAVTWRARARRAPLRVDAERGRFVADAGPRRAYLGIMMFVLAASQVPFERVPNTQRMRLSAVPGLLPIGFVLFGLYVLVGLTLIVTNRPRVVLDRDGMSVAAGLLRKQRLSWTDTVAYSAYLGQRNRWLYLQTIARDLEKVIVAKVPVGWLDVDPILLQRAVRTYTDQPQRRDQIGAAAELARLTLDSGPTIHSRT